MDDHFSIQPSTSSSTVKLKRWTFTKLEIIFTVIAVILLVVCAVFLALYVRKTSTSDGFAPALVAEKDFCLTKECMEIAAYSINLMNTSVDPCEDFYEYACGNYQSDLPPPGMIRTKIEKENERRIEDILTQESAPTKWEYQRKLLNFYKSCLDDYQRSKLGGKPFLDQIVSKLGGWSLLGTWNETGWNLNDMLKKVQTDFRVDVFFVSNAVTSSGGKPMIEIFPGDSYQFMDFQSIRYGQARKEYKDFVRNIASMLLRDANLANVTDEEKEKRLDLFVSDVFTLGMKILNLTVAASNMYQSNEPEITVDEINKGYDGLFDWKDQLSYTFRPATVKGDTKLITFSQNFFSKLPGVIKSIPKVDRNRILQNYMLWYCAKKYLKELSREYFFAEQSFTSSVDLFGNQKTMKDYCMDQVTTYMNDGLSAFFVSRHLDNNSRKTITNIVLHMKKILKSDIDNFSWMDARTKTYAKSKLDKTLLKLGHPDWMSDGNKVDAMYLNFTVNRTDFFSSMLSANQFIRKKDVRSLKGHDGLEEWPRFTFVYHAELQYLFYGNEIIATAGILQRPMYDVDAPYYVRFGSFCAKLGSHLYNVVGYNGQRYDKKGNFTYDGWWSSDTLKSYIHIQKCVSGIYATELTKKNMFENMMVNVHTIADGIANINGLHLALKGYQDWVKSLDLKEKILPGLGLSPKQMVFLSFAQTKCSTRSKGQSEQDIFFSQGPYGFPDDTNMMMGQMKEFSNAFHCDKKSKMNPKEKCTYA